MGRIFEKRKHSIFKTAAQNSKLYSKYSKQLYMAAKNGVPDPEANPVLRSVVEKAKRDNVLHFPRKPELPKLTCAESSALDLTDAERGQSPKNKGNAATRLPATARNLVTALGLRN